MVRTRVWCCAAVVLFALLGVLGMGDAGARTRATITVCQNGSGQYTKIQLAVNAAAAGDTIRVCGGTYVEQVFIDKNLTLEAIDPRAAEIKAPAQMVPGPGLPANVVDNYAIVTINGANVTIRGFTIAGPGGPENLPAESGERLGRGVNVIGGGSVTLTNNRITDIRDQTLSGNQTGIGVAGGNVTATGNTIDNYQKGGFFVNVSGVADIQNNTVDAGPRTPGAAAPNGIQVSRGASGIVKGNVVLNNSDVTEAGTGILIYLAGNVTVTGNTVEHNQNGIVGFSQSAPLTVEQNAITDSNFGIDLFDTSGAVISDNTSVDAIKGGLVNESPGTGNTWLDNSATGALSPSTDCIDLTTGSATAGTGNTWTGNVAPTAHPVGICTLRPITTIDLDPVAPDGPNGAYSGPVHVTVSADPAGGPAVTETRCVLDPPTPPTTFADLPSTPCPYLGTGADVSAPGLHTVYAMSINAGGLTDAAMRSTSFTITKASPPDPPPLGADLALTKTASSDTVHPGGQVTYQLVVQNHGPGDAMGVTVEDPSPSGLSFVDAHPSQGQCTITRELRCSLGTVAAGGEALVQLTATVAANASGAIVNTATVWDDRVDPNPANNTATSAVHVTAAPPAQPVSDLVITKQVDRRVARLGQRLTYTITVTNKGPDAATNVRVADALALPVRVRVVSTHPRQGHCHTGLPITCTLGSLHAGARITITIVAVASVTGRQTNTAAVISESRDPHPRNNVAAATTMILRRAPSPPPVTG
jgi:uncharacterized repeat protein (TIGR01451 family)